MAWQIVNQAAENGCLKSPSPAIAFYDKGKKMIIIEEWYSGASCSINQLPTCTALVPVKDMLLNDM